MMNYKKTLEEHVDNPDRRFVVKTKTPERSEWLALRDATLSRPMLYDLATAMSTVGLLQKMGVDARYVWSPRSSRRRS